mgnify:FL=1
MIGRRVLPRLPRGVTVRVSKLSVQRVSEGLWIEDATEACLWKGFLNRPFCAKVRGDPLKVRSEIRCMLSCETLNLKIYVYTYTYIHMYIYICMYINISPQGLLLPPTRCVV